MVHIKIKRGLDIPIKGLPTGDIQPLIPSGSSVPLTKPKKLALDLSEFMHHRFKLLKKEGDTVKIGEPLVYDKQTEGVIFISPAGGVVTEITRGHKRAIMDIVISTAEKEETIKHEPLDPSSASREAIIRRLKEGGGFSHIRKRPFNTPANPDRLPRSIFVKAIETAPFVPPPEMQVEGHEDLFQAGLDILKKLTDGTVHLVHKKECDFAPFTRAYHVKHHTAEGPHPAGTLSVHIEQIDPILHPEDVVWTLNVHDVLSIASIVRDGVPFLERIIGIGGPAAVPDKCGYFKVREGFPVEALISGRLVQHEEVRLISGDPLTGKKVSPEGFLGFNAYSLVMIEEPTTREPLHFFRLGANKYTYSRAYASGHLDNPKGGYDFTTSLHGERRAFIEPAMYDKVQPLNIPTIPLLKAIMAEDYELAEELGLLEVDPEDFALSTFVCPSKIDMTQIVRDGQESYMKDVLH
ncbi:MAG: Na(+)-translocating NADH-quinone reductase subunit A [Chlamydiia bacterium]|nr:Na(+)-translocating NADH-quinone reductase subunit A [Chlamydiia bacterium]